MSGNDYTWLTVSNFFKWILKLLPMPLPTHSMGRGRAAFVQKKLYLHQQKVKVDQADRNLGNSTRQGQTCVMRERKNNKHISRKWGLGDAGGCEWLASRSTAWIWLRWAITPRFYGLCKSLLMGGVGLQPRHKYTRWGFPWLKRWQGAHRLEGSVR